MRAGLLFSGGTDSTLAALLLDRLYDVTLVTVHIGITDDWRYAEETAEMLGFPFESIQLDQAAVDEAIDNIHADGTARQGIQTLHTGSLEAIAERGFDAIADGTRRDDRVPSVPRALAQQLETAYGVDYVAPLSGFGPQAVDRLVDRFLEVTVGPSPTIDRPDYESELRALCATIEGMDNVSAIFPTRQQSAVTGYTLE